MTWLKKIGWTGPCRVVATGTHAELLKTHPAYRAVVTRDEAEVAS